MSSQRHRSFPTFLGCTESLVGGDERRLVDHAVAAGRVELVQARGDVVYVPAKTAPTTIRGAWIYVSR